MDSPRHWASSSSTHLGSGQSTLCPQPGEARYNPYQKRISKVDQAAMELAALTMKQGLAKIEIANCMKSLSPYCGACFAMTGDLYSEHLVGAGCRFAQNLHFYIPIGHGWEEFRNDCQIKTGPVKFCYGCLLPLGRDKVMAHDNAGAQGEYKNKIAQIGWTIWNTEDLRTLVIQEFHDGNMDLTRQEYVTWCGQPDSIYFSNLIKVFTWLCNYRGFSFQSKNS